MNKTLAELATQVSRKRGDLDEETASSDGSTTTLISTSLCIGGDNEYSGDEILFINRVPVVTRRVTASDISTYTLTLAPALSTATASGEAFEKRRKHLYRDVVAAINSAIIDIAPVHPIPTQSSTRITLLSGQTEYSIPAIFKRIHTVEVDTDSLGTYRALAPLQWDVRPGSKLWVAEAITTTYTSHNIRISGYRDPATLSSRDDATPIPVPYILAYCDWYLTGQTDSPDPKLLDSLYKTKEFERSRAMTQVKPNTKAVLP
jgi:hypothetical protein